MITKQNCSTELLHRLLAQDLSERELQCVESHLESCIDCREQLDTFAAEPLFWESASKSLSGRTITAATQTAESPKRIDESVRVFLETYLAASDDPAMLGRIGNYEVSGVVGIGAMGIVLKAFDKPLHRFVAIKVLLPSFATQGSSRERFSREARAAAAVVHPNVIAIHSIDSSGGLPYLVMPYVGGQSLQKRIDELGPLAVSETLRVGYQIASGLSAAHALGLIHRDIKPSNILLESGVDRLLITDFGLAQAADDASLTQSGVIAGTPAYMSPEQARGDSVDARSDLFSLGSLLYTLCTGHAPFRAETTFGVLRRVSDEKPRSVREINPETPDWLCQIVCRLHEKSPSNRFESAAEVADLFERCIAHVSQPLSNPLPVLARDAKLKNGATVRTNVLLGAVLFGLTICIIASIASRPDAGLGEKMLGSYRPKTIQREETPLRYAFAEHQKVTYFLTMSAALPSSDMQLDGLVTVEAESVSDGHYQLSFSPNLQMTESARQRSTTQRGDTLSGQGQQSNRWHSSRSEIVVISDRGQIISHVGLTELPYDNVSIPELLFRTLPESANAASISSSESITTFLETGESADTGPLLSDVEYFESMFLRSSGIPEAVRVGRTVNFIEDDVEHEVPIQLEFTRLSDNERDRWLATHGHGKPSSKNRQIVFPPQEEQQLLADLQQGRRILYWLHRVRGRSKETLSLSVVDAIAQLTDHPSHTIQTLVARILADIPQRKLNPFRIQ
ncbi:MAG: protein kinase [Rubripirellula sp.]